MLKETESKETIVSFVVFLLLVAFQLGSGPPSPPSPPGFAYGRTSIFYCILTNCKTGSNLIELEQHYKLMH